MKMMNAILIFAAGFALGITYGRKDLDRRCNEIVEKEFASFKAFREEQAKKEEARSEEPEEEQPDENDIQEKEEPDETEETKSRPERSSRIIDESEATAAQIISKSEYGQLGYQMMTLELFPDMSVEDTYGNPIKDPEGYLGIGDLYDLFDGDDQTVAYIRNDEKQMYFEVIREV